MKLAGNRWMAALVVGGVSALGAQATFAQLLLAPRERAVQKPLAPSQATPSAVQLPSSQPRGFELVPGQQMSFGMPIGQAGPVSAELDVQGESISVWIEKPDGKRVGERPLIGRAMLQAQATEADLKAGPLWKLVLKAPAKAADGLQLAKPVARGNVKLSHPGPDLGRLQTTRMAKGADAGRPQDVLPLVQQEQAAINAREAQVRQSRQQDDLQKALAALRSGAPLQKVEGGPAAPEPAQASGGALLAKQLPPRGPAAGSISPVGATGTAVQGVVATNAPPRLTVNPSRGSPGDVVTIEGSGFGAQPGTVQFTVAPGRTIPAPIVLWSDTGVVVRVPDVDGVVSAYHGPLSVSPTKETARSASFEFVPATEVRLIVPTLEQMRLDGPSSIGSNVCHPSCAWGFNLEYLLFGQRGQDVFFPDTQLRNGWRVEGVGLRHRDPYGHLKVGIQVQGNADAAMLESRVGTDSPFLRVGWWRDAGDSQVNYWPFIQIRGPKGTPHF